MECKKCKFRRKYGYCSMKKTYVPKKVRKDGSNPALYCNDRRAK